MSTDVTLNEEESLNDSDLVNHPVKSLTQGKPPFLSQQARKSASNARSTFQMRNSISAIAINRMANYEASDNNTRPSTKKYSKGSSENLSSSVKPYSNDHDNEHSDHADAKYSLDYVLSRLDEGYYMRSV